jgi:hypothetical protein
MVDRRAPGRNPAAPYDRLGCPPEYGEGEAPCPAGSFIFIPAEMPHGFRVGDVPSRKLNLYLPASMVGYFDDLSEAMKKGEADPERLNEIALRYAVEAIGPAPEGYL